MNSSFIFSSLKNTIRSNFYAICLSILKLIFEWYPRNIVEEFFKTIRLIKKKILSFSYSRIDSNFRFYLPCFSPEKHLENKHRECYHSEDWFRYNKSRYNNNIYIIITDQNYISYCERFPFITFDVVIKISPEW